LFPETEEPLAVLRWHLAHVRAIARLRLEWSIDADEHVPSRLFLKMSRPDQNPELAGGVLKEVTFYDTVVPLMPPRPDGMLCRGGSGGRSRGGRGGEPMFPPPTWR